MDSRRLLLVTSGAFLILFLSEFCTASERPLAGDNPYVEVISERWNFADSLFAGWPTLPAELHPNITQLVRARFNGLPGIWLYCNKFLYFVWEEQPARWSSFGQSLLHFVDMNEVLPSEVVGHLNGIRTQIASYINGSLAVVATPIYIFLMDCPESSLCNVVETFKSPTGTFGEIKSVVFVYMNGSIWVGSSLGLWKINLFGRSVEYVTSQPVHTMAWRSVPSQDGQFISCNSGTPLLPTTTIYKDSNNEFGLLVIGSTYHLTFFDGHQWWQEWVSMWGARLGAVVDGPVSAMTFDLDGRLWIGNNVSLSRLNVDYTFDRIGPLQGLPYGNITAVVFVPGNENDGGVLGHRLYLGTTKGVAVLDIVSNEFAYYYGPRWHPGDSVSALGWLGNNRTIIATNGGLAALRPEIWTLAVKADHYEDMVDRHTRDPGLVADCSLTNFVSNTCTCHTTDNDGLWTSIVLASELFRYEATHSLDSQQKILKQFAGIKFLNDVTGITGLMARSVVRQNVPVSGGIWYNSTTKPGWKWKADTSSDEVVGHMFVLPLVYDFLLKSFTPESLSAQELVSNIVGYIVKNGFQLIDKSGYHTRWGVWSPTELNTEPSWADERGLNSLQILTYLVSAYQLTGNKTFMEAWQTLYNESYHGVPTDYGRNMINQKITFPLDDNYSDDELAFLPYFTYFYSVLILKDAHLLPEWQISEIEHDVKISLERTWRVVAKERSSLWTAIYLYATGSHDVVNVQRMVQNLRNWPLELIQWQVENSHRLDVTFNREPDR
jgi:hypothetical protein